MQIVQYRGLLPWMIDVGQGEYSGVTGYYQIGPGRATQAMQKMHNMHCTRIQVDIISGQD